MDKLGNTIQTAVKISTSPRSSSVQVRAEAEKFSFAETVFKTVFQRCPEVQKHVELVPTYLSEIDKVGKMWKMLHGNEKGTMVEDAEVVVQKYVKGRNHCFLEIGKTDRIRPTAEHDAGLSHLLSVVHESYTCSGGECVIAGMHGVRIDERGQVKYYVTSLTIHSQARKYGEKDKGEDGVEVYKEWKSASS